MQQKPKYNCTTQPSGKYLIKNFYKTPFLQPFQMFMKKDQIN